MSRYILLKSYMRKQNAAEFSTRSLQTCDHRIQFIQGMTRNERVAFKGKIMNAYIFSKLYSRLKSLSFCSNRSQWCMNFLAQSYHNSSSVRPYAPHYDCPTGPKHISLPSQFSQVDSPLASINKIHCRSLKVQL